jgi:F-type H+-transporting ATPase subunit delta
MAAAHRVYARALFEAAQEKDRLAQVREDFGDFLAGVEQVPELDALLKNPQIDRRAKAAVLEDVLGGADELFRNFLLLTLEKNRANQLREIHKELERLIAAAERRLNVELTTAFELGDDEAQQIVQQIEQASGRKVEATRTVDPDLIGGLVLQAGSLRVDASVRGRIERLRRELTTVR